MSSLYEEYRPPVALADRVMCLWTQQVDGANGDYHHPVLPSGCVDIVWIGGAAPVVGPATRRVIVGLPAGTGLVGFAPAPWRGGWKSVFARLSESDVPHPAVRAAVALLTRHPSGRIGRLARFTGLGERQLHRRFREAVGYGPKMFQRIMRFQRLLLAASADAYVAADLGYADQAHMCREVRALAGEPMSDLFKTRGGPGAYPKASMIEWLRSSSESANHPDHARRR